MINILNNCIFLMHPSMMCSDVNNAQQRKNTNSFQLTEEPMYDHVYKNSRVEGNRYSRTYNDSAVSVNEYDRPHNESTLESNIYSNPYSHSGLQKSIPVYNDMYQHSLLNSNKSIPPLQLDSDKLNTTGMPVIIESLEPDSQYFHNTSICDDNNIHHDNTFDQSGASTLLSHRNMHVPKQYITNKDNISLQDDRLISKHGRIVNLNKYNITSQHDIHADDIHADDIHAGRERIVNLDEENINLQDDTNKDADRRTEQAVEEKYITVKKTNKGKGIVEYLIFFLGSATGTYAILLVSRGKSATVGLHQEEGSSSNKKPHAPSRVFARKKVPATRQKLR